MMNAPMSFAPMPAMRPQPNVGQQGMQLADMVRKMQAQQAPTTPGAVPGAPAMPGAPAAPGGMPPMGLLQALFSKLGGGGMGGGAGAFPGNEVSLPDPMSALGG